MQARSEVVPIEACRYGSYHAVLLRSSHTLSCKTFRTVAFTPLFTFGVFLEIQITITVFSRLNTGPRINGGYKRENCK